MAQAQATTSRWNIPRIIFASSAGTLVEWYDFYIFGSLSTTIASKFYTTGTPTGDLIAWLATFAIGFMVRPFGAIVFGRIGDLIGRKYTFLVTMTLMGLCTFAVGLLPTKEVLGEFAGIILIALRILQGLALGGEYGGAATYIAEHSPQGQRGFYTSWIQTTATIGLFASLFVILLTRNAMGNDAFAGTGAFAGQYWAGWRIPFLLSIVLVLLSLWIRLSLRESPLFQRLKDTKTVSKNPLAESFGNPVNRWWVALALFGATMGQGVVWYTGQFYALFWLQNYFKVPLIDSNLIIGVALVVGTPLFVFWGWLSDKVGRKPIMMWGMLLAVLTYLPIYGLMNAFGFVDTKQPLFFSYMGYNPVALSVLVFVQVIYVTMVYGPIAAFLVELFPTKIRYTSMSLPYHLGNGVFGGLVPILGLSFIQATGNIYAGLAWPMLIAGICFVVGTFLVKETNQVDIADASKSTAVMAEEAAKGFRPTKDLM